MPKIRSHMLLPAILVLTINSISTALPSAPQDWASHKRALLQLQSNISANRDGNTTTAGTGMKLPTVDLDSVDTTVTAQPPTTPAIITAYMEMTTVTKPTEQQAEQILKLLLANLDHGDVRSIALKLLPEYTKFCATTMDCEELHSALRRLYLTRYSELQLALHRMDKLGLLLRRVQYLIEQGTLDAGVTSPPHHHHGGHHRRRRPSTVDMSLHTLRRVERKRVPVVERFA